MKGGKKRGAPSTNIAWRRSFELFFLCVWWRRRMASVRADSSHPEIVQDVAQAPWLRKDHPLDEPAPHLVLDDAWIPCRWPMTLEDFKRAGQRFLAESHAHECMRGDEWQAEFVYFFKVVDRNERDDRQMRWKRWRGRPWR